MAAEGVSRAMGTFGGARGVPVRLQPRRPFQRCVGGVGGMMRYALPSAVEEAQGTLRIALQARAPSCDVTT